VVTESLKLIKDLSAGKALLVLGILLIVVSMWTVDGGT
jgi:hypothetical protein